jgi:hypothetical protein
MQDTTERTRLTDTLKVPSNFTEVLMALIFPYHTPKPIEELLELESSPDLSTDVDLLLTEDNHLTYIPSSGGVA